MRRARIALLVAVVLTSGCVGSMYGVHPPRYAAARPATPSPPVGRWDNVMILSAGTPVQVLTMEAGLSEGRMVAATGSVLRLGTPAGELSIAASDVVRVDRLPDNDSVRQALRGAATGTGAAGVLGLLFGRMPPARLFAAAAITGAYTGVQMHLATSGSATIYLADRNLVPTPAGKGAPARR